MQPEPAKNQITIEPWDASDFPLLWNWCQKFWWDVCDDDIPFTENEFVMFKEMQGSINLGVYRDGRLSGILSCDPINSTVAQVHCIFRIEAWGRDFTKPALQVGIDFAFEKLGYKKLVCMVYEHNKRIRALLEDLGAEQEGRHRNQTKQRGEPVTMISYGIFREE